MIDDLEITLRKSTACCMMDKITVRQAKRYVEVMGQTGESVRAVLMSAARMLPEIFGGFRPADVLKADVAEVLTLQKALHFVMQEITLPAFLILSDTEPVEQEASAFDEYDEENGYNDTAEADLWDMCRNNIETITQAAIKILRMSYTDAMNEELVPLLEHLRWEIDNRPDQERG